MDTNKVSNYLVRNRDEINFEKRAGASHIPKGTLVNLYFPCVTKKADRF